MISLDDWSELVTVNYMGGYCGDFFTLTLAKAHNNNLKYFVDNRARYRFDNYDAFNNELRSLNLIRLLLQSYESHSDLTSHVVHYIPGYHEQYLKLFNVYFRDSDDITRDIREYLYLNYKQNFNGNVKFANFHNHNNRIFSLQQIFPKSKNIYLSCPKWFFFTTRTLYYIKTLKYNTHRQQFINSKVISFDYRTYYNKFFNEDYFSVNCNDEFEIDIFELLFNGKCYDEQLSDYLNLNIKLNKQDIEGYKNQNIKLLKDIGIDLYKQYDKEFYVDTALKHFKTNHIDKTLVYQLEEIK